jgi:hypothetical protein
LGHAGADHAHLRPVCLQMWVVTQGHASAKIFLA